MTSLKRKFLIFHHKNLELWRFIEKYALEKAENGWLHYGIGGVIERARWETPIQTKGSEFKINNDFCAFWSRLWMLRHPRFEGFFRTRRIPDDFEPDSKYYGPPPLEE